MNKKPGKGGKSLLYLQAFINGKRSRNSIGLSVEPTLFDHANGLVKKEHPNYNDFNILIRNKLSKANSIAGRYRILEDSTGKPLTKEIFEYEFNSDVRSRGDFIKWFDKRLQYRIDKNIVVPETTGKTERTTCNKLTEFRPQGIKFSELTPELMDELNLWMQKVKKNSQNTRWQMFKHLGSYLEAARGEGLIIEDPLARIDCPAVEGETVYLEMEEMQRILNYSKNLEIKQNEKRVLQYFIFACFTGIRISDVQRISFDNIINGQLVYVPKKTIKKGKFVSVPLNDYAIEFLSQYKPGDDEKVFDTMKDQPTNRVLKTIALKCEIHKRLTFHVARHSFATLFLELGGKIQVLQKYLGHSKIQTTMRYAHISDKEKHKEMERFNGIFK